MNNLEQLSKMIEHQSVLIEALTKKVEKQQAYIHLWIFKIRQFYVVFKINIQSLVFSDLCIFCL